MSDITKKEPDASLEEKDRRFRDALLPRLSLLLSVFAILISVLAVVSKEAGGVAKLISDIRLDGGVQKVINICNALTAFIAFVAIAALGPSPFNIRNVAKFKSLMESEFEGDDLLIDIGNIKNRVEKLVNQYRLHMILFAFSFVLLYVVILFAPEPLDREHINFLPIAINVLNFLGALFVYLGFNVLHNKTLEAEKVPMGTPGGPDKNKPQYLNYNPSLYWGFPILVFVFYITVFIVSALAYKAGQPIADAQSPEAKQAFEVSVEHFLNRFDLLAGLANGLAMSLLFGKYVSIEQSLKNTALYENVLENIFYPFFKTPYKAIVSFGIIFVLPTYALAQPLFGSLRIDVFGDAHRFQTIVYAICLFGKVIFFHLTYLLISKKLLHLYLYGLVSEVGNFKELGDCFADKKEMGPGAPKAALLSEAALAED
jgi:hypothetical protein